MIIRDWQNFSQFVSTGSNLSFQYKDRVNTNLSLQTGVIAMIQYNNKNTIYNDRTADRARKETKHRSFQCHTGSGRSDNLERQKQKLIRQQILLGRRSDRTSNVQKLNGVFVRA